ncbi:hypothetical protein A7U60_g1107 [Sanghuangporus baumii]|uniref:Reverse transcriptase domain-containing protein n=1 Tax=Sanghuangporus baumii TaxID=108892 RepID=A0A9Q5I4K6_SANBA|nr:hypothetical protein A7U60_g1107 [Sanghuangporus baumii]
MRPSIDDDRLDYKPTWARECAEDPEVDLNLAEISVLHFSDVEELAELRPPCAKFNQSICLSQATCPSPHVCSRCFSAEHPAFLCADKSDRTRSRTRKEKIWCENVSYTPCARISLYAEPLPRPPPRSKLPPDLVRVVDEHPELFKIVTSIDVDTLEALLSTHPNRPHVESVIFSLREGFWPYAGLPKQLPDESWRQRRYYGPKQDFLVKYVEKEIVSQRFSRPFGRRLLKGMAAMPIHVARGQSGKLRLIYDHSSGENSLNSLIPKSERSAAIDRIDALIRILRNRELDPTKVTLFKSDVSHAFRILPMSPYWQALQAVKINDQYYIDRCNTFGNAASQRLFCAFYSLVLWIAENVWRLPDICCYVDDNFSWDFASRMKDYNGKRYSKGLPEKQARLLELWDLVGIPHAPKKQEFGSILSIVGFRVDLKRMRVAASEDRLKRIIGTISEFRSSSAMTLHECQKFAGSINWIFEVNPLLRPGIDSLHREMANADQSNGSAQVEMTKRIVFDLQWLSDLLQESKGIHFTSTISWGPDQASQTAYVCASSEGFGIWFPSNKQAFYHRYQRPVSASFVSDIHIFAIVCAIDRAVKSWNINLEGRPGRFSILTLDKPTVAVFGQLRARDELRDTLLLALELLVGADIDFLVSQLGKQGDFAFVSRLSHESKDVLDTLYSDMSITIRELNIPTELARRAGWKTYPRKRRISSRSKSISAVSHLRCLDFHVLYKAGYRGAVIDKDNCLTIPYEDSLVPELKEAWEECKTVFGAENILVAESVSHHLGVPVLRHGTMKPGYACISAIRTYFASLPQPIPDSALFIAGDRIFTDVILANRMCRYTRYFPRRPAVDSVQQDKMNGASWETLSENGRQGPLSIHVERIWQKDSNAMRYLESKLVGLVRQWNSVEVEDAHKLFVRS